MEALIPFLEQMISLESKSIQTGITLRDTEAPINSSMTHKKVEKNFLWGQPTKAGQSSFLTITITSAI